MKIGLIREGKIPSDSRVVLTPIQVKKATEQFRNVSIKVQSSSHRSFSDQEYLDQNIETVESVEDCDVLIGVKEVPMDLLIKDKTYFFFSHTIKAQAYNRELLLKVLEKQIRLIDYECLVNDDGLRVIAFGRWAGIVGAHNSLYTWGERTKEFSIKRAKDVKDFEALKALYKNIQLPAIKIAITGNGRVANGSAELLDAAGVKRVEPHELIDNEFDCPVYAQLNCEELYVRKSDGLYESSEFYQQPDLYDSIFNKYQNHVDLFINAVYWDPKAPAFFSAEDMAKDAFRIKVIADITCDIAPDSSVPSTLKPSTIADPIYGYDPIERKEIIPFQDHSIDIMAIDNLPNELPRDASTSFGEQFLEHVLPELIKESSDFIDRATIAKGGKLTSRYQYLQDFVDGK